MTRRVGEKAMRFCSLLFALVLVAVPRLGLPASNEDAAARVSRILQRTPLIDGHNDLPWEIRDRFHSKLSSLDLSRSTADLPRASEQPALMTDIPRLRQGQVGGQFWSVWVPGE